MKNRKVKIISSVVVLVILCGAYVGVKTYVAKQEEEESEAEEKAITNVCAVSTDDIKTIKFLIDKKEVTFQNSDDGWVKIDEKDFPVNQDKLDEVAGALNNMNAERVLNDVDDLSQYGLDSPQNTITVTTSDGKKTDLRVGEENESVSQYYIEKDDEDRVVYLVPASAIDPFMSELYDYAKGNVFPEINSANVDKIQVEGNNSYTLENNSGIWSVSNDGIQEKADSAQASSAASTLGSIEYDSFINYNASDEEMITYGLNDPYADSVVDYKEEAAENSDALEKSDENASGDGVSEEDLEERDDSEENASEDIESEETEEKDSEPVMESKELIIHVGNECGDGTRYVNIDGNREIYTVSTDTLSAFTDKSMEDFLDMSVCDVYVNNLDAVEVDYKGETDLFNVSRETSTDEDGNETETKTFLMNGSEMDEGIKFTTFYNKLTNMAGKKRLTEKYAPEKDPEMKVLVVDTDKNKTEIDFYSYDTNYYAAVVDEKVYMVNKMTVKEMFESYEKLLEVGSTDEKTENIVSDKDTVGGNLTEEK